MGDTHLFVRRKEEHLSSIYVLLISKKDTSMLYPHFCAVEITAVALQVYFHPL